MNKKIEKIEKKVAEKDSSVVKKESTFKKKKKVKRNITSGIAYVYSTFNNTIISIADENGNVVSWSSAGAKGFKGMITDFKSRNQPIIFYNTHSSVLDTFLGVHVEDFTVVHSLEELHNHLHGKFTITFSKFDVNKNHFTY